MNNSGKVEASKVDSYLTQVRAALHGLPEGQVDDILRELRGHALELAEAKGVEAALNSLGDPVDLAKTYRAENQIIQGECSGSPLAILLGLRHASRSRAGRLLGTVLYVQTLLAIADRVVGNVHRLAVARVGYQRQPSRRYARGVGLVADTGRDSCGLDFAVLHRPGGPLVASPVPPLKKRFTACDARKLKRTN
jgi:hypothetical protein